MGEIKTLYRLKEDQTAKVIKIMSTGSIRRRLMDLGIVEGTEISCAFQSYSGDPIAYYVRGTLIALRAEETIDILIEYEG